MAGLEYKRYNLAPQVSVNGRNRPVCTYAARLVKHTETCGNTRKHVETH